MKRIVAAVLGLVALGASACGGEFGLGAPKQASVGYEPRWMRDARPDPGDVATHPCRHADAGRCLEECQSGDVRSCNAMGVLFEYGSGTRADSTIASGFYARACDDGYAPACTNLAWLYSLGRGVPRDAQQAMLLFTRAFDASKLACRRGDGHGCFMAGEFLLEGKITPKDEDGALAMFKAACEEGEPRGCDYVSILR
jgi:TPR repeat protein